MTQPQKYEINFNNATVLSTDVVPSNVYVRRVKQPENSNMLPMGVPFARAFAAMPLNGMGRIDGLVRGADLVILVRVECVAEGETFYVDVPPGELDLISQQEFEGKESEVPELHSIWRHRNGNTYEVYDITNAGSEREKYPTRISYRNTKNGEKYSRDLADWHRSMTLVTDAPKPESWDYAQHICDTPSVDEILRNFRDNGDNDTAVCLILEVMRVTGSAPCVWAPCTPGLLESGVDCATTPRRPGKGYSHDHLVPASRTQKDYALRACVADLLHLTGPTFSGRVPALPGDRESIKRRIEKIREILDK